MVLLVGLGSCDITEKVVSAVGITLSVLRISSSTVVPFVPNRSSFVGLNFLSEVENAIWADVFDSILFNNVVQ